MKSLRTHTITLFATIGSLGILLASASPAAASGCTIICGGVSNSTNNELVYTRALQASTQKDWCDVWNIGGGDTWDWAHVKCGQRPLEPGDSAGGLFSGFDVDAFSFATRGYYVRMPGGPWRWRNQGVWTKIHDNEYANCYVTSGDIHCSVSP